MKTRSRVCSRLHVELQRAPGADGHPVLERAHAGQEAGQLHDRPVHAQVRQAAQVQVPAGQLGPISRQLVMLSNAAGQLHR